MTGNLGVCDARDEGKGEVILVGDATACWKKSEESEFEAEIIHGVHVESLREFASIEKTGEVVKLWRSWNAV
jgi:hypothetical protein